MRWEDALLPGEWHIGRPCVYGVLVIALTLIIRCLACLVRALENRGPPKYLEVGFWRLWLIYFGGGYLFPCKRWDNAEAVDGDYWHPDYFHPTILGLMELVVYPICMAVSAWPVIGAWISFKAVAQWGAWKKRRASFNRFLIGNALVLIASYIVLACAHIHN